MLPFSSVDLVDNFLFLLVQFPDLLEHFAHCQSALVLNQVLLCTSAHFLCKLQFFSQYIDFLSEFIDLPLIEGFLGLGLSRN